MGNGIPIFAGGLLAASRTRLTNLNLSDVGLGSRGMAALSNVIRAGCFERLEDIDLTYTPDVTDDGVHSWTEAVEGTGERGLPMLARSLGDGGGHVCRCEGAGVSVHSQLPSAAAFRAVQGRVAHGRQWCVLPDAGTGCLPSSNKEESVSGCA